MEGSTAAAGTFPRIGSIIRGALALALIVGLAPTAGASAKVVTVTVSAQTSGAVYGHTITPFNGAAQTISVTATNTTPATLIAQIIVAHNANAYAGGAVAIAAASSTTYTLTDRTPGANAFTYAEIDADNKLSASTSAGADATAFTFGRYAPTSVDADGQRNVAQPSVLVGAVLTLTQTHDASGDYSLDIITSDPLGVTRSYPVSWTHGANAAATDTAATTALTTAFGSTLATAAVASTGVVTLTLPIGYVVTVADVTATGGSAALSAAVTASATAPYPALILRDGESSTTTVGAVRSASIAGTSPTCLMPAPGPVLFTLEDPGAAVTAGTPIWIDSTTGSPRAVAAPGRYMHPTHAWVVRNTTDLFGNTVAVGEAR